MKIDTYISTLLYEHDCVIIPGFGGFVTGYAPAKVHPTQHLFTPPHKNITFNKHLKTNDGLLANEIVQIENKTFAEANSVINSFVAETNSALMRGNKVMFNQIGSLFLDVDRSIRFEPDNAVNYLTEAFGMEAIQSLPIKRESVKERIETKFIDRAAIPQERKKRKLLVYAATSLVLLFATSLLFLSLQINVFKNSNYSSLNPFTERMNALYVERPFVKSALTEKELNAESFFLPINDTAPFALLSFADDVNKKLVVKLHENTPVAAIEPDKTSVVNNTTLLTSGLNYHVVSGCFKVESNAQNFVKTLKSKNLNAAIIGQNKDGLFMVSCGDFSNKDEAYRELGRIRSKNTAVWLYEN